MLKILKIKLSVTVCYLIPVDNKYLLVDTGYEKDKDLFYRRLSELHIQLADIAYVLLTHHHDDHAGLLQDIKIHNPSCRIIMHTRAISHLKKGKNNMVHSKYINGKVATLMKILKILSKRSDSFPPYEPDSHDILIEEETLLNKIGINIPGKIILTPGHTDDSISLLLNNGLCFVGDAASNMLQFLGTRYCVIVIDDLNQYYKSWEMLIKKNVKTLYPGHGKPFTINELKNNVYSNKEKNLVNVEK